MELHYNNIAMAKKRIIVFEYSGNLCIYIYIYMLGKYLKGHLMPSQTVVLSFLTFSLIKLLLPAITSVLPPTGFAVAIAVAAAGL